MGEDDDHEVTELDLLAASVQRFVSYLSDEPTVVVNAVVVWESMTYDEDGEALRSICYAVPDDAGSMSGALGLLHAGGVLVQRDVLDGIEDD